MATFDELVREGESVPTEGWDFSWFEGHATEERPPWGYWRRLPALYSGTAAVLDVQTGGGEVFAQALAATAQAPRFVAATESWRPNLELAERALAPWSGGVVHVADDAGLPFADDFFDVVSSRHPNVTLWREIARVLRPGGTVISQQVSPLATNRELYEFFLGPQPQEPSDGLIAIRNGVADAGLELLDLQYAETRVEFFDIAAIVYFLRKVLWTVPGFTVDRYRDRLRGLHTLIERRGSFVSYSRHALVMARKESSITEGATT
jgi:SAM-dependent methyltransferase